MGESGAAIALNGFPPADVGEILEMIKEKQERCWEWMAEMKFSEAEEWILLQSMRQNSWSRSCCWCHVHAWNFFPRCAGRKKKICKIPLGCLSQPKGDFNVGFMDDDFKRLQENRNFTARSFSLILFFCSVLNFKFLSHPTRFDRAWISAFYL